MYHVQIDAPPTALTALGIRNDGVCPTCLDERRAGVNNDRTDALELATRLDRYLAGNDRALGRAASSRS